MVNVCLVLVLLGVALAEPDGYGPVYKSEPLPYYYDYNVYDGYKGTNFGQHEKSDGKAVYGSYTVDLPDGRKQTMLVVVMVVVGVTLANADVYEPVYYPEPLPYYFNYNVYDDYKGANYGQQEKSDGKAVYGSYTVDLPDGRKQRVDYTADHYKGYVAKVLVVLVVVGVTLADPDVYEPVYKPEPLPYYFNYNVYDDYKGTNYGQQEKSDGKAVYGSYTVDLPDGRKQRVDYTADHYKGYVAKVDYTADHYKGYVAKVSYYGKAQHPKHYGPAITFKHQGYGH
ncbi:Pro-resilin-like 123 [Homarus americanus]|uniref:Pro-resilin-like 123 n=1 Tax=Homarus americanus TaxID=6706 RepID=A0A8J5MRV8_HOMAM|nr:Pro-resilin-like 123 [Homarus americanus]